MPKLIKSKAVISLIRASTVKPRKVIWFWKGRIAIGTVDLLAGDPDQGKTQIATYLASKASRGHLVGDLRGTPRDVVIVSAEDSMEHTLVPRLMAVNADLDRIHFVHVKRDQITGVLDLLHDLTELQRVLGATNPALLIIDPLVAHIPSQANSNQDQHVRLAMAPLGQIADEFKLAVLAVSHLNKGQESSKAIYRLAASIGFVAAARSALLVAPDPREGQDGKFLLGHIKSNLSVKAPTLQYSIVPMKVNVDGEVIETSRIQFDPHIVHEIKGADILALGLAPQEDKKEGAKLDHAKSFLRHFLKCRRQPVEALKRLAKDFGISAATLERAKKELKIKSDKPGLNDPWFWYFPSKQFKKITPSLMPKTIDKPEVIALPHGASVINDDK